MEIVIAKAKNVRGSAQKARIPARVVEGMKVTDALPVLEYMPKKAALDVYKVVKSAAANATNNNGMNIDNLIVKSVRVDRAFGLKRYKSAARGMARPIKKHFCHIMVELVDSSKVQRKEVKKAVSKTESTKKAKATKKTAKKTKTQKDKKA